MNETMNEIMEQETDAQATVEETNDTEYHPVTPISEDESESSTIAGFVKATAFIIGGIAVGKKIVYDKLVKPLVRKTKARRKAQREAEIEAYLIARGIVIPATVQNEETESEIQDISSSELTAEEETETT